MANLIAINTPINCFHDDPHSGIERDHRNLVLFDNPLRRHLRINLRRASINVLGSTYSTCPQIIITLTALRALLLSARSVPIWGYNRINDGVRAPIWGYSTCKRPLLLNNLY